MDLSVVILAAGAGTRMKSNTPKVLHTLCGREMLYYAIREAKNLSDDITIVLFHQHELVRKCIEQYFDDVRFVIQDHVRYPGTGGALMGVMPKHEKVLVLNGDMPLVEASELENLASVDSPIVMSVLQLDNGTGYGRVVIRNGEVERIIEEKDASESERAINTVNAGVYCLSRELMYRYLPRLKNNNAQHEYYLTDVITLARDENVKISPIVVKETNFKGVNSKADLAEAEAIMLRRIREKWLKAGVKMRLPETIYIDERVEFIGECELENGVSIIGESRIEESHIKAHSVIEESQIIRSDVGPMAHIRPKCDILDSHIGNFVEVKKACLSGVKAGHLSYLGDCAIESGTNIGAGVITCNYDGRAKHQTIIGKNVFVGSDSQLIAPVVIEDDVIIGAGSTITHNVKSGELAISRAKQESVAGFFARYFSKKG
ncbi:MAG: bifunctional UDP-N-acetylglucosamine diphosphorylase/glucosamine-1-phosphate N-acetyltransferase GlmU [Wolinella sp.]